MTQQTNIQSMDVWMHSGAPDQTKNGRIKFQNWCTLHNERAKKQSSGRLDRSQRQCKRNSNEWFFALYAIIFFLTKRRDSIAMPQAIWIQLELFTSHILEWTGGAGASNQSSCIQCESLIRHVACEFRNSSIERGLFPNSIEAEAGNKSIQSIDWLISREFHHMTIRYHARNTSPPRLFRFFNDIFVWLLSHFKCWSHCMGRDLWSSNQ